MSGDASTQRRRPPDVIGLPRDQRADIRLSPAGLAEETFQGTCGLECLAPPYHRTYSLPIVVHRDGDLVIVSKLDSFDGTVKVRIVQRGGNEIRRWTQQYTDGTGCTPPIPDSFYRGVYCRQITISTPVRGGFVYDVEATIGTYEWFLLAITHPR